MPQPKNILTTLADNASLIEAVRSILLKQFQIPENLSSSTSDEVLGQYYRAKMSGTKAVEEAFKEIAQYKTTLDRPARENPGR